MLTQTQLRHILSDAESHHVERTTSTSNMDKFCQAICAFSNDVSGSGKNGYLVIGSYDDGKLSGLKVDDRLLLQIANIRTDGNVLPQPVMTVEKFSFNDGDVLVAEIQPSSFSERIPNAICPVPIFSMSVSKGMTGPAISSTNINSEGTSARCCQRLIRLSKQVYRKNVLFR